MDEHLEDLGFDEDTGARKRARALSASRSAPSSSELLPSLELSDTEVYEL